jgi:hypothetical protein
MNKCKLVSEHKFNRVFKDNLHNAGTALVYKSHNDGWKSSLSAVVANGFVYAVFPTKAQAGSRLTTYHVKYALDNPIHHITFIPFPKPVEIKVEF